MARISGGGLEEALKPGILKAGSSKFANASRQLDAVVPVSSGQQNMSTEPFLVCPGRGGRSGGPLRVDSRFSVTCRGRCEAFRRLWSARLQRSYLPTFNLKSGASPERHCSTQCRELEFGRTGITCTPTGVTMSLSSATSWISKNTAAVRHTNVNRYHQQQALGSKAPGTAAPK